MKNNVIRGILFGDYNQLFDTIRWNSGNLTIQKENLASHQYVVSVMANCIAIDLNFSPEARLSVLDYAMHHDWDELFTGDIGHNVKYNKINGPELRETLKRFIKIKANAIFIEKATDESELLIGKIISEEFDCLPSVKLLIKVCDWLSMVFFCKREVQFGNSYFHNTLTYCLSKFDESVDSFWKQIVIDSEDNAEFLSDFAPNEEVFNDLRAISISIARPTQLDLLNQD